MALTRFDAPGFLQDLDEPGLQAWSDFISQELDAVRERQDPQLSHYAPRHQFFNPLKQPPAADAVELAAGASLEALRAVFEVPAAKNFVVGDITINGRNIEFGVQMADFIPLDGCVPQVGSRAAAAPSLRQVLAEQAFSASRY